MYLYWSWALGTWLAATGARAGLAKLVAEGIRGNSAAVEFRLQELAKAQLAARGLVDAVLPRQATSMGRPSDGSAAAPTVINPDGSVDMKIWDIDVRTSCTRALAVLPQSSNPTGVCVCYNLPVLNNMTGQFEADLRLFHLNAATGQFAGIPPQNVQVSVTYHGAAVSAVQNMTGGNRVHMINSRQQTTNALAPMPVAGGRDVRQIQQYMFIGQIDMTKISGPVTTQVPPQVPSSPTSLASPSLTPSTSAQLEALVTPTVTLSAVGPGNQIISTNVSTNEASFLVGVFSDVAVFSGETLAIMAVNRLMADMRSPNSTTAFVLPGVSFLVMPIGMMVTGVWLVIGLLCIGFGTVERNNHAEQYRYRMQHANKGHIRRI